MLGGWAEQQAIEAVEEFLEVRRREHPSGIRTSSLEEVKEWIRKRMEYNYAADRLSLRLKRIAETFLAEEEKQ
jgi:hypothetical protein